MPIGSGYGYEDKGNNLEFDENRGLGACWADFGDYKSIQNKARKTPSKGDGKGSDCFISKCHVSVFDWFLRLGQVWRTNCREMAPCDRRSWWIFWLNDPVILIFFSRHCVYIILGHSLRYFGWLGRSIGIPQVLYISGFLSFFFFLKSLWGSFSHLNGTFYLSFRWFF